MSMSRPASRFGLDSLMLIIVLIAACGALMREALGLGIFLAILLGLALSRTIYQVARRPNDALRMSAFYKVIAFCVSVAAVLLIGIPTLIAFGVFTYLCHSYHIQPALCLLGTIGVVGGVGWGANRVVGNLFRE